MASCFPNDQECWLQAGYTSYEAPVGLLRRQGKNSQARSLDFQSRHDGKQSGTKNQKPEAIECCRPDVPQDSEIGSLK
jgi:hypothetical protein